MIEFVCYYLTIGFFVGITMLVYVVKHGGFTSAIESMLVTAFWPFYIISLCQRKIALWILKIIK